MFSKAKMQETIGLVLLFGMLISFVLVLIGGTFYLLQHGSESLQTGILQTEFQINTLQILQSIISPNPINIIELGLLILVFTQLVRVALLAYFYLSMRDFWFSAISIFILSVLIYSFFWRN